MSQQDVIRVTCWQLRRYRWRTQATVTLLVMCGVLFGLGFGGLLVLWALNDYIQRRRRGYARLLSQHQGTIEFDMLAKAREIDNVMRDVKLFSLFNGFYGFYVQSPHAAVLCRTCQSPTRPEFFEMNLPCPNLQDALPHNYADEPPIGNPFIWYWFTFNGYRLPPSDWPSDKPWLPATAVDGVEALVKEGREYYEQHPNPLWDAGFGNIPDWYVPNLEQVA